MAGCGANQGTGQGQSGRDFPPAPPQQVPESATQEAAPGTPPDAAPEATDTTADTTTTTDTVPLADLVRPDWLRDVAARTEIPARTLAAYAGASLRLAQTDPQCGIGWNTLAGIGAIETVHGSYLGATTDTDGLVSPPIIGIPLDGSEGVKKIVDTDDGALDEDTEWDRAVGPMQFIPTTWESYAQDGNLDGRTDPNQLDDAALTAAIYLCESGGDVTTDDGWATALVTYNRSVSYAHDVTELAESYAAQPDAAG